MSSNTAAILTGVKVPLEIKQAPYPVPKPNEIIIKTKAVAINPTDWAQQLLGPVVFSFLTLPAIIGEDAAGEVVAIGSSVTRFKLGDRVTGLTHSAFQEYVTLSDHMATTIPSSLDFETAAVIPMGLVVSMTGLFSQSYLGMQLPSLTAKPTGETVLIWGGSTSVGSNAIQLAVAAGYEVISTSSPKNADYVKRLGASQVFDHYSATIKEDLVQAFKGKTCAGAFANGAPMPGTHQEIIQACAAVVAGTPGKKFIACTMAMAPENLPEGVGSKFVDNVHDDKELGYAVFGDFCSKALEAGSYTAVPQAEVAGKGLEAIQGAMDLLKKGVSAKKIVVLL